MQTIEMNPFSYISHFLSDAVIFFITFFCLLLPAQPDNVQLTVREVTTSSTVLSFEIKNNTNRVISRADRILIEKNTDGIWEKADISFCRTEESFNIIPGTAKSDSIDLSCIDGYNGLSEGEYRITVSYRLKHPGSVTQGKASAVFTVTS